MAHSDNDDRKKKGIGSGWFAVSAGIIFFAALIYLRLPSASSPPPELLFQAWLAFSFLVLVGWGAYRIRHGKGGKQLVGQPTINFVVAILGATIALYTIVRSSLHNLTCN